jgi:nicotinate phosphoribosyltransferase
VLGLLCQASGIATKAARCKQAAGERSVVSFGARRAHPVLAPMIERNAYIGGCDGVAVVASAERLGLEPVGTMPHALILLMGDAVTAAKAFDEVVDRSVKRVVLVDTFSDEKIEAVRVAEAMGQRLYAVRLDTPASRRGDRLKILREVRWELDLRGYSHVKLFVSGGIDEEDIRRLNPLADAYGVGTAISNAPVLDFALDIVEIHSKPIAKRGKPSGRKQVWRCPHCLASTVTPWERQPAKVCGCQGRPEPLLQPLLRAVRAVASAFATAQLQLRARVLEQLRRLNTPRAT